MRLLLRVSLDSVCPEKDSAKDGSDIRTLTAVGESPKLPSLFRQPEPNERVISAVTSLMLDPLMMDWQ